MPRYLMAGLAVAAGILVVASVEVDVNRRVATRPVGSRAA